MLSEKFQRKILEKIPPHSLLRKFLKTIFYIKNCLFLLKEKFFLSLFKLRNFISSNKVVNFKIKDNLEIKLLPKGAITFQVWKQKEYEKYNLNFILDQLSPGAIFFDIGANIGIFSLTAAKKEPQAKVYAFEPCRETFRILKENIRLNNLNNILAYQSAVGDYNGEALLKINASWRDGLNTLGEGTHSGCKIIGQEKVPIVSLDNFVIANNIQKVDIMKVDVEGAELFVFKGAQNLLKKPNAPLIVYESTLFNTKGFHYHPVEIMWLLKELGYFLFELDNKGNILFFEDKKEKNYNATIIAVKSPHSLSNIEK